MFKITSRIIVEWLASFQSNCLSVWAYEYISTRVFRVGTKNTLTQPSRRQPIPVVVKRNKHCLSRLRSTGDLIYWASQYDLTGWANPLQTVTDCWMLLICSFVSDITINQKPLLNGCYYFIWVSGEFLF